MTGNKGFQYVVAVFLVLGLVGFCDAKPNKPTPACTLAGLNYACNVKCATKGETYPPKNGAPNTVLEFKDLGIVLVNGVERHYTESPKQKGKSCVVAFTITDWGQDASGDMQNGDVQLLTGKVSGKGLKNLSGKVVTVVNQMQVETCNVVGKLIR